MNNKLFLLTLLGVSIGVSTGASYVGAATKPTAKVARKTAVKAAAKPTPKVAKPPVKPMAKPAPKPSPKPTTAPVAAGPLYQNNLEKIAPGKLPPEFLVLGGEFVAAKDEKNSFIELPGEPIDAFGLLFGPALKEEGVMAQLRAFGTKKGRRVPAFGVGVFGVAGYKARLSPAAGKLEILKDEEIKASVTAEWTSESWTWVKIQAQPLDKKQWKVQAKSWPDGSPEPEAWQVEWTDAEAPPSGRAMLIGAPYSGTPLHFDDLFMDKSK